MTSSFEYEAIYRRTIKKDGAAIPSGLIDDAVAALDNPSISRCDILNSPTEILSISMFKDNAPAKMPDSMETRYRPIFPACSSGWDVMKSSAKGDASTSKQNVDPNAPGLLAVVVDVHVMPGTEELFIKQSIHNCQNSGKESGVYRFDLLQNVEDSKNFILVEIYTNGDAAVRHKATSHYKAWAEVANPIMAKPRAAAKYTTCFPSPLNYHKSSELTHPGEGKALYESTTDSWWSGLEGLQSAASPTFTFNAGPKIMFSSGGAAGSIASTLKSLKLSKPLIITGKEGLQRYCGVLDEVFTKMALDNAANTANTFLIDKEPTVEDAIAATQLAVTNGCDSVIAIGGGSALDLGKAASALMKNSHRDIYDYLEVVGKGMPMENDPAPFIAVPTTSGTGSEVTKNAVLKSVKFGRKVSIRHEKMYAVAAVLDPTLTLSCTPGLSANVGMDALCQLIEPFISNAANPFSDAFAKEGMQRAARSLRTAVRGGEGSETAREDMAIASVMGGVCLANAKLGTVHGFASVLGGMYDDAAHGAICACLLPACFEKNAAALQGILVSNKVESKDYKDAIVKLSRLEEVSRIVTGNSGATVEDGCVWMRALLNDLQIPRLSEICNGIKESDFDAIIDATASASSTKGNPVVLSNEVLRDVLMKSL